MFQFLGHQEKQDLQTLKGKNDTEIFKLEASCKTLISKW